MWGPIHWIMDLLLMGWIQRLKEIMSKDSNSNLALRITVESGGCHGFQYLMSLTTLPPPPTSSSSIPIEDQSSVQNTSSSDANAKPNETPTFDEEEDTVFEAADGSGAKVVLDGPSLELLKGSKIDYTMELIGSQFKIVDNPLATSSCGCGTSFDIKVWCSTSISNVSDLKNSWLFWLLWGTTKWDNVGMHVLLSGSSC